jgi:hypothetical protein
MGSRHGVQVWGRGMGGTIHPNYLPSGGEMENEWRRERLENCRDIFLKKKFPRKFSENTAQHTENTWRTVQKFDAVKLQSEALKWSR